MGDWIVGLEVNLKSVRQRCTDYRPQRVLEGNSILRGENLQVRDVLPEELDRDVLSTR